MTIWSILRPLEILYGHLEYFVVILYIYPRFGILDQENSGNPALASRKRVNVKERLLCKLLFDRRQNEGHMSHSCPFPRLAFQSG
jgi:hypothetical protein